jgi:hypothetical protein
MINTVQITDRRVWRVGAVAGGAGGDVDAGANADLAARVTIAPQTAGVLLAQPARMV